jgi:hypothetical protein
MPSSCGRESHAPRVGRGPAGRPASRPVPNSAQVAGDGPVSEGLRSDAAWASLGVFSTSSADCPLVTWD